MNINAIVHVAGPREFGGLYQTCTRCGYVLQDFTGSRPMVVAGTDPTIPAWPEGERIGVAGNATYVLGPVGRPLDSDEQECRPAS